MKGKISLNYEWWNSEHPQKSIKESHREALEESAEDRIIEMMKQGFSCGELLDNISMDDEDGDEGVSYRGSWSMRTEVTHED